MNKIFIYLLSLVAMSFSLASCSDWTDDESVGFESNKVDATNPALYKKYLEDLKNYKNSDHKVTYAWFDNSRKQPITKAHHMASLPDSLDYIVLEHSDVLADWELKEMETVRQKSIKVLSQFDFDAEKAEYDSRIAKLIEEGADVSKETPFIDVLVEKIASKLKSTDRYGFDGLIFAYAGKGITYMTPAEKAEYIQYHNITTRLITIWKENNPNKVLTFAGKPSNIMDRDLFTMCKHIVIVTNSAKNFNGVTYEVSKSIAEDIPSDRFVVTAKVKSLDKDDITTGYWSDGSLALPSVAAWVNSSHNGYSVVGMGIYNVSNDYYNPNLIYPVVRNTVQLLNPSLKIK